MRIHNERYRERLAMVCTCAVLLICPAIAQHRPGGTPAGSDPLLDGFRDPPPSARPRTWWHWMNGNVTEDGIRKDLAWMKRIGIGGVQQFDANISTPQIVPERLSYMHPAWKKAFRFAAATAQDLGLELTIASSPGWSETGGPWVKPQDAMKKLVWSSTDVRGGARFRGRLASPPSTTGAYLTLPYSDELAWLTGAKPVTPQRMYGDIAVLAYPIVPPRPVSRYSATIVGRPGVLDDAGLTDDDLESGVVVPRTDANLPGIVTMTYHQPQTVRSATIFFAGAAGKFTEAAFVPRLEASQDGSSWAGVADMPLSSVPTTVSFAPTTARFFRITFRANPSALSGVGAPAPGVDLSILAALAPKPLRLTDLRLSSEDRVDQFERKAGFAIAPDYNAIAPLAGGVAVDPAKVVDLTPHMQADGTLDWIPPKGLWRIVRIGWSLTGATNHPATAEATGLEVDKYDGDAVRRYLDTYLATYREVTGGDLIGDRGVKAILTDSIEVGASNWTPTMIARFKNLRGYDPVPYLPALTGAIVGSREASDKFLYDYRRTLSDLIASEHYNTVAEVAHANGLKVYGEALENGRPSLGDDMAMRAHTDVPMAAMWTFNREGGPMPSFVADIRGAVSVADVYGKNLVAAESMTSFMQPWAFAPNDLRRVIDLEFALGVNRPVIHTSVHQPVDDKQPGLSLSIFGQYFNRHETWAEMARPWIDYIARSSFMLQQGRNVTDIAYFYGEEAPLTVIGRDGKVDAVPAGYAFDFVNRDALLDQVAVDGTMLATKGGARYSMLYLGRTSQMMTLPVLRRLAALADAGATIVGDAPDGSPALHDDPVEYRRIVGRLWSGKPVTGVGKGRVIAGRDMQRALDVIGLRPDFAYAKPKADTDIIFRHRRMVDGDSYFAVNRTSAAQEIQARFRIVGRRPELWDASRGTIEPLSYRVEDGLTIVPLRFDAEQSYFIVFRNMTVAAQHAAGPVAVKETVPLDGPWDVAFQAGRGAPKSITMPSLAPLETNALDGIRYFSGVATYSSIFHLPPGGLSGRSAILDLGRVGDLAEVRINGRLVGTAWHAPFKLDVGDALRAGTNRVDIRVANLWVNRLIGDKRKAGPTIAYTALPTYNGDAPLRPSGLIGPVAILIGGQSTNGR